MTKRFVSLLMALMLIIGIFAVPAMAAQEDEGIEPCVLVTRCDWCDATIYETDSVTWSESGRVNVTCRNDTINPHRHDKTWEFTGIKCRSCGQKTIISSNVTKDICNIGQV